MCIHVQNIPQRDYSCHDISRLYARTQWSGRQISLSRIDVTLFGDFIRLHISFYLSPGYYGDGLNAIIVFAACFLPDSSRADYHYVMENLFL